MSENRVGTCHCGGPLIVDWQAVLPVPHCLTCGDIASYTITTAPAVADDVRRIQQEKDGMKV